MARRSALLGLALLLVAFACSTPYSADSPPDTPDAADAADAADSANAADVDMDDAGPNVVIISDLDGSIEAAAGNCVPFTPMRLVAVPGAVDAVVCGATDPNNAILGDGGVPVGLDLKVGGVSVTINQENITACVGADFGVGITTAFVRMRATGSACGIPCNGGCGVGDSAKFFAGSSVGGLQYLGHLASTPTYKTVKVPIPAGNTGRFFAVCRPSFAAADDDLQVDAILGCP